MWGISYGGFTSLQVAALRPPHLRAIVPIQASDDRYTDDVHYVGGCMTVSELSQYAVSQVAMNALPPSPEVAGPEWRSAWRERLEATPVWLLEWARHQRDGPYWRRGSIAPGYDRIEAAILQFAGWMDEYVDAALRIQARCTRAPRRTIVGNWVHGLPDHAYPGPNVDWLGEVVRFLDRWLGDGSDAAMAEPALTWFRREFAPPERFPEALPGCWRALSSWPPVDAADPLVLALDAGGDAGRGSLVRTEPRIDGSVTFHHDPTAGTRAGTLCWGAGHPPNGLAGDLRREEAFGPVWTSDPLETTVDVLGVPVAVLHVSSTEPVAHLVARVGDVHPDGRVHQVSEGILNLTHRASHSDPVPVRPGQVEKVSVSLRAAGYRFRAGHRIRLSLASAHWPVVWPSPGRAALTIHHGPSHQSRLELPLEPSEADAPAPPVFASPGPALSGGGTETAQPATWEVREDVLGRTLTIHTYEGARSTLPSGGTLFLSEDLEMAVSTAAPGDGRFANECVYRLQRDAKDVEVVASGVTHAGATAFEIAVDLRVRLDGEPFFECHVEETIPRDLL